MRKPADLRKAEIVTTVLDLADQIGPDRVTTGAVSAAVGVTQGAIFRHFPTKAALWQAVAKDVEVRMTRAWDQALISSDDPLVRLRALVEAQFAAITTTPALPMLLFSRELNVANSQLRTTFHDLLKGFRKALAQQVRAGQEARALRKDVPATDAAALLISLVQGGAIRWSLGARDFDLCAEGLRLFDVQLRLLAT